MNIIKGLLAALVLGTALTGTPALAADGAKKEAPKDVVLKGDAKCTSCHDEADAPEVLRIGKTRHGTNADKRTPTCTSCHGESEKHVNYKGSEKPPKPDRWFSKKSNVPAAERNAACLECHQGGKHMNWEMSAHANKDVTCASCHSVHAAKDKVRDKRLQAEVCYTCHKQQRADMQKYSHHPVPEGKMTCSDCHNPHGTMSDTKLLVKDTVNQTCFTCHAEKRGPFVHNHAPVEDNCMNCHNPHGTAAPSMLNARMPFLCQQCHGSEPHPGNIPSERGVIGSSLPTATIGVSTAQGRGCVNCHTNIHGSNSPANIGPGGGAARLFR